MANIKSAIKRVKIAKRNHLKNLEYKEKIRKATKAALKTKSSEDIRTAIKCLDKAASKNVVSKNMASRKKSRLMKMISTSSAK